MSESDGEMLQRLGIDGHAWASEYCKWFGEQYPDLETIHGWFANAIMAGVDHEGRKRAAREKRMREARAARKPNMTDSSGTWPPSSSKGWTRQRRRGPGNRGRTSPRGGDSHV